MDGENPTNEKVYRILGWFLMYLTSTRSNIMYIVSILSKILHCASKIHMIATKRVLRYLMETLAYGISFSKAKKFQLQGYSYSDWVGSLNDMRSTSGYCFKFGSVTAREPSTPKHHGWV